MPEQTAPRYECPASALKGLNDHLPSVLPVYSGCESGCKIEACMRIGACSDGLYHCNSLGDSSVKNRWGSPVGVMKWWACESKEGALRNLNPRSIMAGASARRTAMRHPVSLPRPKAVQSSHSDSSARCRTLCLSVQSTACELRAFASLYMCNFPYMSEAWKGVSSHQQPDS